MEDFSAVTRFCILCNYVSRIIDAITSRCAKFRFKPLIRETLSERIRFVANREGVTLSDHTIERLDVAANGDLRLAIMYLQSAAKVSKSLEKEDFVNISGCAADTVMRRYFSSLCSPDFPFAVEQTRQIVNEGFSANQILLQLHRMVVSENVTLSSQARSIISMKIAEVEKKLLDKGDDYLQLLDLAATFHSAVVNV